MSETFTHNDSENTVKKKCVRINETVTTDHDTDTDKAGNASNEFETDNNGNGDESEEEDEEKYMLTEEQRSELSLTNDIIKGCNI